MNHKRKRPKNRRAGCLMCKYHKQNGLKGKRRRTTGDSVTRHEARANVSFRQQLKAVAVLALLLAAPLAAQEPDSLVTETTTRTAVPVPTVAENPPPIVQVDVATDSIVAVMREHMANQAVREAFAQCGCTDDGIPERVYWGALAVATLGLILWSRKEVETTTITNSQSQDQTTTVTTRRGKWRKKHGGEDE